MGKWANYSQVIPKVIQFLVMLSHKLQTTFLFSSFLLTNRLLCYTMLNICISRSFHMLYKINWLIINVMGESKSKGLSKRISFSNCTGLHTVVYRNKLTIIKAIFLVFPTKYCTEFCSLNTIYDLSGRHTNVQIWLFNPLYSKQIWNKMCKKKKQTWLTVFN